MLTSWLPLGGGKLHVLLVLHRLSVAIYPEYKVDILIKCSLGNTIEHYTFTTTTVFFCPGMSRLASAWYT